MVSLKTVIKFKNRETVSGGSVANSIVALSQLGNKVGFIGKISDDSLGVKYERFKKRNVLFFYTKKRINSNWNMFDINYT